MKLPLYEKIFPFRVAPLLFDFLSREANKQSQKLFPFVKLVEKHGGVHIHLNGIDSGFQ